MSLELLSDDLHAEMQKKKKEKENTFGCHIKVDGDLVKLSIPLKIKVSDQPCALTEDDIRNEEHDITLTFSKREVKELLQDLYVG